MDSAPVSIRLDKWLWQARLCKSRSEAARLIAAGKVRINAVRVNKAAAPLRVGDGVSFAQRGQVRVLRVAALGTRRGPAPEARGLYRDLDAAGPPERGLEPAARVDK